MDSNELRLFISSTLRGLEKEREHLIKNVFPQVRLYCRQRGVTFTEIDLRSGAAEVEDGLGRTIRTCLEEVDKCQPYFIGIFGDQYGWVPDFLDVVMDSDLIAKYPWVEQVAMNEVSLVEMEVMQGALNRSKVGSLSEGPNYISFYHRSEALSEGDDLEKLNALIERIKRTSYPFCEYADVESLGQLVYDDLIGVVDKYWPEEKEPSLLEIERRAHTAFASSRKQAYIPNPLYLKTFREWLDKGDIPLVISGESGLGKSALVAFLVDYYRRKNPDALVVEHYVGASETSGTASAVTLHVIEELVAWYGIEEEVPTKPEALEQEFSNWLFRAGHLSDESDTKLLIVIDALNLLGERGQRLAWLPEAIPKGVKVIVSTTPGKVHDRLLKRGWQEIEVLPLTDKRVRQSIIVRYLGEYQKRLLPEQLTDLVNDNKGLLPLYLRVVAEELRLATDPKLLDAKIKRYVSAETIEEVFQYMLERLERDYGEEEIQKLLPLVCLSHSGLSEVELLSLTGLSRIVLSRLMFALENHLVQKNGLFSFFHDFLRRAVEQRYLTNKSTIKAHRLTIASYFQGQPVNERSIDEVPWQLQEAEEVERLRKFLSSLEVLQQFIRYNDHYLLLGYWLQCGGSEAMAECYSSQLEALFDLNRESIRDIIDLWLLLTELPSLFIDSGVSTYAVSLMRKAIAIWQQEVGQQHLDLGKALLPFANLLNYAGEFDEAEANYQRSLNILKAELGDNDVETAKTLMSLGALQQRLGRYKEALSCSRRAIEIYEKESKATSTNFMLVLNNLAIQLALTGEIEEAKATFFRAHELTIQLYGSEHANTARSWNNLGNLHVEMGEYEKAREYYESALNVRRKVLGKEHPMTARAMHNLGHVFVKVENYEEAEHLFRQSGELLKTKLGETHPTAVYARQALGDLHIKQERYQKAKELFEEMLVIYEEHIGTDLLDYAQCLHSLARIYEAEGNIKESVNLFERALSHYEKKLDSQHNIVKEIQTQLQKISNQE